MVSKAFLGQLQRLVAVAAFLIDVNGAHDIASGTAGHKRYFQVSRKVITDSVNKGERT